MIAGDDAAFEALYDRRQRAIYRYALRMCGSEAVAEDITQDVFIALMKDAAKFDQGKGTAEGYLFGMARHRVLRYLERRKTVVPLADGASGASLDSVAARMAPVDPLDAAIHV